MTPGFAAANPSPALRLEAWATPPAYTGAAPVFLAPEGGAVTLPLGSRLQVSLSGAAGAAPVLRLDAAEIPMPALDAASYAGEVVLDQGGQLRLQRDGSEIAAWSITVLADTPPRARFTEPPARSARGLAIRIPWRAEDDWGVASLVAELRLHQRAAAPPQLTRPAAARQQAAQRAGRRAAGPHRPSLGRARGRDPARRPRRRRAGRPVGAGHAPPAGAQLQPPRRPRRRRGAASALSLDPTARSPARQALDEIAAAPDEFDHDTGTFLALRASRHRLVRDRRPQAVEEVQAMLWELAIALEEGRADRTARALAAARQALREAIERAAREEAGATPEQREEMEQRVQALREAIRRHLETLAERLQQENAEAMPFDPTNRLMDRRELDRRTERMREAAREGRTEDAERELAELEEMLRALEEGRSANAEQRQRQERQQRGRQQMGAVQDMVRRQGDMLDRGHQRSEEADRRRATEQRRGQRRPPPPAAEAPAIADPAADARRQRALRRALGEMMQQFGDLTGEVPEGLGRADQAMRESGEALAEGRDARDAQGRAMRALMEGGRQMAQEMQRQGMSQDGEGEGEPQDSAGQGDPGGQGEDLARDQGEGRDPLGRRQRENAGAIDNGSDTLVPDEAEQLRTRRLQEELRRRLGERERAPAELDYIDRLLRRF